MTGENISLPWYRLAFTKRWLGYLLLTVIFAGACVGLGMWQFARRDEAQREIVRVLANYDSAPVSLNTAVPDANTFDESHKWQPVSVTGTYLTSAQLLVRSRPRQQQAGYEVLTPLLMTDGRVFIIDRGWLPVSSNQDAVPRIPQPPAGVVTVTARLKAGEPSIAGRGVSNGQLATIELPLIASLLNQQVITGAYGLLATEAPGPPEQAPLPALRPEVDEGPHLSYALQWLLFALMGFCGLGWAIRNEMKIRNADLPAEQAKAVARAQARRERPTEEDIEDALLDAHR
jgi:cytochrome oxidase assembly protein ShyY1